MPATGLFRTALVLALVLTPLVCQQPARVAALSQSNSASAKVAVKWLINNQFANGTWANSEIQSAPAAYALWLNNASDSKTELAYSWLSSSFTNPSSWYWDPQWGEADVPGMMLFSLAALNQTSSSGLRLAATNLLQFQNSTSGGFRGYENPNPQTSSVDTALALLGLTRSNSITPDRIRNATSYLSRLENADGSFNLTLAESSNSIEALGPDQISITALVTLSLGFASFKATDLGVSSSLQFLVNHISSQSLSGHPYATSLMSLALDKFNRTIDANRALAYLVPKSDGGFRDDVRLSNGSNALDTGWAAVALETVRPITQTQTQPQPAPSSGPFLSWIFILAVLAVTIITGLSIAALLVSRRHYNQSGST